MKKTRFSKALWLIWGIFMSFSLVGTGWAEEQPEVLSESWMGIYMEGIKVGYSYTGEMSLCRSGEKLNKTISESWMKVSRLGGNPVEIETVQESLYKDGQPLETVVRTMMSGSEIVIEANITDNMIRFKSEGNVVKELPYTKKFYFDIPIEKIIKEGNLEPDRKFTFRILDPLSRRVEEASFEIFDKEDILILGRKKTLWRVKTMMSSLIPLEMEEWMDDEGRVWKSVSRASFMTTTAIRMTKQKALEESEENFDIAFSSIIKSNVFFDNPQQVKSVTFRLSGVSPETIKNFPFDDGSQKILEVAENSVVIRTISRIFDEENSIRLPVEGKQFQNFLRPTSFCQSDDPEIIATAQNITGEERNAWKAAKRIAEWVGKEMTANYDVGFASAKEILKNKQGDCSEHTVLAITLCRAVGIPARAAVGIMYGNGIFAYHMWPEVYVGHWINLDAKWLAVDEASGEYYTDATHIKFGRSSLDENIFQEMVQAVSEIIGKLQLQVIDFEQERQK
jgi:hypothetical protein